VSSGSRSRRRALLLAAIALCLAPPALAAELPVELVAASTPVTRPREAALEIRTEPGASCTIAVISRSGPARATGLSAQVADAAGRVGWRWGLGAKAAPGRWPIVVTCQKGPHLGRLETSLQVR
jgi:hypothetical protein